MTSIARRLARTTTPRVDAPWRRRLKVTRAGAAVIALTLAVGFAAFNTGNNLLFFGWGLMLSSILVSGILSEATLRAVHVEPHPPSELRAGTAGALPFVVENRRRGAAFAVELQAMFTSPTHAGRDSPRDAPRDAPRDHARRDHAAGASASASAIVSKDVAPAPLPIDAAPRAFLLRVDAGARRPADLVVTPRRRGAVVIDVARAFTAFPFGFFEKEKRVAVVPPMQLVVFPARVDVGRPLAELLTRLGESPARRPGAGDEIFSLRPFRAGDDPRRVAWRRSAKTGRVVVKETEAARSHDVILELSFGPSTTLADLDRAADVCGSLAEDLLARGHAVGLRAGATLIAPAAGPRQRSAILTALALVDAREVPAGAPPARRAVVVAVVARGSSAPRHASVVVNTQEAA